MKAASFFSGIGGFDLALRNLGVEIVYACEIDPFCRQVYAKNLGHEPEGKDIRDVRAEDIPPADLWVGGPPCQDLSVAGRRRGLVGERSGLFHELARLVGAARPRFLLLEQVPGLLSSHSGRDMETWLGTLADLGYLGCFRVLDGRFSGVAQRRERVLTLAVRDARDLWRAVEVLALTESGGGDPASRGEAWTDFASTAGASTPGGGVRTTAIDGAGALVSAGPEAQREAEGPARALFVRTHRSNHDADPEHWNARDEAPTLTGRDLDCGECQATALIASDGLGRDCAPSITNSSARGYTNGEAGSECLVVARPITRTDGSHGYGSPRGDANDNLVWQPHLASAEGGAGSLTRSSLGKTVNNQTPLTISGPRGVRRLTVTECERLFAFPDGWTCCCGVTPYSTAARTCADGPRYRALGNAVIVSSIEWAVRRLLRTLEVEDAEVQEAAEG